LPKVFKVSSEEKKRPLRRTIYYPVYEDEKTEKTGEPEVEVTPKPLLMRQPSRPYIFPIVGQIIELIMGVLEARLELIRGRAQRPTTEFRVPKKMTREVVRDELGRVISEEYTVYE